MSSCNKIGDKLSKVLKPISEVQETDVAAAVALLLKPVHQDLEILLVKRARSFADPWSGQMAFPGGKRDLKDRDLLQTAIRETFEETSINLYSGCCLLGALENTRSGAEPNLLVAPFVILVKDDPAIELSKELVGHLWVPLGSLSRHRGTARLPFGEVPAYVVKGHVVWGLTYKILEQLFKALEH
jgi:8-oxo-dGTP pyrophosphatase MutT (NUDIX family)